MRKARAVKNLRVLGSKTTISDKDFFQKINLDYPGLEKVREVLAADDYSRAKPGFVNYMQTRKVPICFPLDMHVDENVIREADLLMDHTFSLCHAYPPTTIGEEIEWNENPVGDGQWAIDLNRHSCRFDLDPCILLF